MRLFIIYLFIYLFIYLYVHKQAVCVTRGLDKEATIFQTCLPPTHATLFTVSNLLTHLIHGAESILRS
jgi:hypothetical protein